MNVNTKSTRQIASLVATLVLATTGTAALAQAKAPEPDFTLSYNVGAVTDYRFRGISQTSFDPAIQGGIDFSHKSGLYLGAFVSNVKWIKDYLGATDGAYELDLYGGFKGEIAKDLTFDIGLITYQYPGNTATGAGYSNANTNEFYGALTYGMFTAKYSRSIGDFIGNVNSAGSSYFELAAAVDLGNGLTLTPHIGRQTVPNQVNNAADYTDYSLSIAKDFGNGLVLSATGISTTADSVFYRDLSARQLGKNTLLVGVKYSF